MAAGARVLERAGYEALTTNRVAEVAGVGIASLYEYFPNKQALVAEVVTHVIEVVIADLRASLQILNAEPEPLFLRAWIAAMFDAVERRRGVIAAIIEGVPFLWEVPAVARARALLLEIAFASRVPRGGPRLADPVVYLIATMTGYAILEAVLRPPAQYTRATVIDALTEIVDRILGSA